jgi:hypothetical protein
VSAARRRAIAAGTLAAVLLLAVGCGSGGGGYASRIAATFVPDRSTPEPASVTLGPGPATDDLVTVHATITDVAGVYGAAFYLLLDPAIASYVSYTPGEVLETGGHSPVYLVDASQPGLVVFSASRLGAVATVDVSGTRRLVSLTFRVGAVGSAPLSFQAAVLYDDQLQPQPLPGIQWFGGTLVGD